MPTPEELIAAGEHLNPDDVGARLPGAALEPIAAEPRPFTAQEISAQDNPAPEGTYDTDRQKKLVPVPSSKILVRDHLLPINEDEVVVSSAETGAARRGDLIELQEDAERLVEKEPAERLLRVPRSSDYRPKDPKDLVENHLVADVVIVAGRKGAGKSQIVAHWAACFTTNKEFVPGIRPCVIGDVAIFHGERSVEKVLVPRLIAAGVDQDKVHLPRVDTLDEAVEALKGLLRDYPNLRMAVIDPLNNLLDGRSPTNAKARKLLKPFLDLCDAHDICVVLVCHFTKGKRDLVDLIGGSGGWTQAAGSVWVAAKIKDGAILQHVECNALDVTGQCWEYAFESEIISGREKPTSRVVMLGSSSVDIETALDLGKDLSLNIPAKSALAIETMLRGGAPVPREEVLRRLEEQEVGLSARHTVKRAQEILQGKIKYIAEGRNTLWKWIGIESEFQSDEWDFRLMKHVKLVRADTFEHLPTMADSSVDCVVTSPPYWGLKDYNGKGNLFGNEPTLEGYLDKCRILFRELRRILKDKGTLWINIGYKRDSTSGNLLLIPALVAQAAVAEGLILRDYIIWQKLGRCAPDSAKNRHRSVHEVVLHLTKIKSGYIHDDKASRTPYKNAQPANAKSQHRKVYKAVAGGLLTYAEGPKAHAEIDRRTKAGLNNRIRLRGSKVMHANGAACGPDSRARAFAGDGFAFDDWDEAGAVGANIWPIGGTARGFDHPCSFPVALAERCIKIGCPPNGVVLDLFMGSGSTAVAAVNLKRGFIGIEYMREHWETAKRRVVAAGQVVACP